MSTQSEQLFGITEGAIDTPLRIQPQVRHVGVTHNITTLDLELHSKFSNKLRTAPELSRQLVSFQASKELAGYRWYHFKEAFSPALIVLLLNRYKIRSGRVLDPFAGTGTTVFTAHRERIAADGIELLPIGQQVIRARLLLESSAYQMLIPRLNHWLSTKPWNSTISDWKLPELKITAGAYPPNTVQAIESYMSALSQESEPTKLALRFAILCVLESVSFTRKDGQYLRWDYRSGRRQGKRPFNKGLIKDFDTAISSKLREILDDVTGMHEKDDLFSPTPHEADVRLLLGSCLDLMPQIADSTYSAVITSPPYCNRYDYTRTYALELTLLGSDESQIRQLRQTMLTCTVENREKDLAALNPRWSKAVKIASKQKLLCAIIDHLLQEKQRGLLNNNGIPRMVKGYFYELACVIAEAERVLKPGGYFIMVNDNVRYAGVSIPVDLILSSFAEDLGFAVEEIMILPNGKGNSSQQMEEYGREKLRKCVYIWRKI